MFSNIQSCGSGLRLTGCGSVPQVKPDPDLIFFSKPSLDPQCCAGSS